MEPSESPNGYQCKFIDAVPDHFYCSKCSLVARELVFTSCCGESFCHMCVKATISQEKPCPLCGTESFSTTKLLKHVKKLGGLRVCCQMKGCDWSGELDSLDSHLDPALDNCQFVDVSCSLKCLQPVPRNRMEHHVREECTKREFICKHCSFSSTYEHVVNVHLPVCKYMPLQCPNRCGVTCEREDMEDHVRICRLEEMPCEFSSAGCTESFTREDYSDHCAQNVQKHLSLTATAIATEKSKCNAKFQSGTQLMQHLQQRLDKVEQKLEDKEGEIHGLQEMIHDQNKKLVEQGRLLEEMLLEKKKSQESLVRNLKAVGLNIVRKFTLKNYSKEKLSLRTISSEPMYTHLSGYKFSFGVSLNGIGGVKGKGLSACIYILPGEFDNDIKWPAEADFTVELVNQASGENISRKTGIQSWKKPAIPLRLLSWFIDESTTTKDNLHFLIIEHNKLRDFLIHDSLVFNVDVNCIQR